MENYPFYPFLSGALVWTALHAINLCSNSFHYEHSGMISVSDGAKDKVRYFRLSGSQPSGQRGS